MLHELDQRSPAGFAIALHVRFTTPDLSVPDLSRPWLDHYSAAGMVMHDPVVRWGLQNIGHMRWARPRGDRQRRACLEEAKDYGLMNGVAVAVVHLRIAQHRQLRARRPRL